MIDDDIRSLRDRAPDRSLDTLEADVWTGVAAKLEASRVSRLVLSCQALALAATLVLSLFAGSQLGRVLAQAETRQNAFATGMEHAPSTLLLGRAT